MGRTTVIGILGILVLSAGLVASNRSGAGQIQLPEGTVEGVPSPVSLTASDGTGLKLTTVIGRAVLDDPLAFTELRFEFENPFDRVIEGNFKITLPQGASISRFAMKIDDAWQEGEVVEKQAARVAYEDFLHRKQDPALLEQAGGNELAARVFPIPARGKKEIIVSYSETLRAREPYVLPLRGLPKMGLLDVSASTNGRTFSFVRSAFAPGSDFVVDAARIPRKDGVRSGGLAIVRVTPTQKAPPDELARAIVLVDTSASRALGMEDELGALGKTLASLPSDTTVTVAAFDQAVVPIFRGRAGAFNDAHADLIRERRALGASNLEGALTWAAAQAASTGAKRVVLFSDGVPTAGESEATKLSHAVKDTLVGAGVERLDAVAVGGIRDDALLERVARGGLPRDGVVAMAARGGAEIARRLRESTVATPVRVEGATWQYPSALKGVQSGDDALVFAEVPEGVAPRVTVGGDPVSADLRTAERPLVQRAWARAKIESLAVRGSESRSEIVALSTTHRVLSPHTALLVLESEHDYSRFGIDRKAKVDIVTIENEKVVVDARSRMPADGRPSSLVDAQEFGMIGLVAPGADPNAPFAPWGRDDSADTSSARGIFSGGTIGGSFGGAGLGLGAGAARSAHATSAPSIRGGLLQVQGPLPPEVIHRVVRQNFGRFRVCYEDGLRRNPALKGTVVVRFVIGNDGNVAAASDAGSAIPDVAVASCVTRAFVALSFPPPASGVVTVTFPISFQRDGSSSPGSWPSNSVSAASTVEPYEGKMKEVMDRLRRGEVEGAFSDARRWQKDAPGDVMALIALGETMEARHDRAEAARAYGSILDLFSFRADSRRFAGERLERLGDPASLALAVDAYARAVEERPDHPSGHRLHAFALLKVGAHEKAFTTLRDASKRSFPVDRFPGVDRILREDLGLVAAAWKRAEPARATEIDGRLADAGGSREDGPSLRFVLNWETDANDVDFHVYDGAGGHAYYGSKSLPSGGELYEDVTTGYGPECFTIRLPRSKRAYPYTLQAHYFSRGPMGYGMGKLEVVEHDGAGGLTFEERPFVIMRDRAFVELGTVTAPK